jgi:hypothetical protein
VLDFYTSLQGMQAMFIAEYNQARTTLSDATIEYRVTEVTTQINDEVKALKPLVGNGEVVDTTTGGKLWFASKGSSLPCDTGSSTVLTFSAVKDGAAVVRNLRCGDAQRDYYTGPEYYWLFTGTPERVTADPYNQTPERHPFIQLDSYVPPFTSTFLDPRSQNVLTLPQQPRTARLAEIQTLAASYGKAGFGTPGQFLNARGFNVKVDDRVWAQATNATGYDAVCSAPSPIYPKCPNFSLATNQPGTTQPTSGGQISGYMGVGMLFVSDLPDGGFW